MTSKAELQSQIDALNAEMESAPEDDDEMVEVTRRTTKDGTTEEVYRVRKNTPALAWLFGEKKADENSEDGSEGDGGEEKKEEPAPKNRNKYFG
jgi:hypothetical protein